MTSIQNTIGQAGRQIPQHASIVSEATGRAVRAHFRWSRGFISAFHGAVALTLIVSMLVLPGPVGAAETPAEPKPTIRVQVLLKSVYIWDDRDWGDGDMHFRMWLGCWAAPTPCIRFPSVNVDHYDKVFSAGSGDTYSLNAVLPGATDRLSLEFATPPEAGYSLFDGQRYELGFEMHEADDLTSNEDMGERHIVLQAENGWGIGDYSLRSTRVDGWGDYTINFEVRETPLPDLIPGTIKVNELAGSVKELVCVGVGNNGVVGAGKFDISLRMDGIEPAGGRATVDALNAKSTRTTCIETDLPDSGEHQLGMVIDEADAVTEVSETNNSDRLKYVGNGGAPVTGGVTNQGRAELSVSAIRVNGSGSGSQDSCKAGKNDIAVVVKNSGTGKIDDFVLRLLVDDDNGQAREQQVSALEADQEREVRFDDVRLKKGERHLTAITDAKQSVDEPQENNNDFLVSVRCESE